MTDANSNPPGQSQAESWATGLGLTHPVLADDGSGGVLQYVTTGFPTYVAIDREMVIQNNDMWPWDDNVVTSLF